MPKRVIYFYPVELDESPVNWDEDLDIPIEYQPGLPTRPEFWKSIENGTLCVIDDLYDKVGLETFMTYHGQVISVQPRKAAANATVANIFKVYSKKCGYTVIITTQNYFENWRHARIIRSNCEIVVIFKNYG